MPLNEQVPITALVITKNEENAITHCVTQLSRCDQVIVVDSRSDDRTTQICQSLGVDVVQFAWNGRYPKKKQWSLELPDVRNKWVLLLDADEIVTEDLLDELRSIVLDPKASLHTAYDIPLAYHFAGKELRFGHRVYKRSFLKPDATKFPELDDLTAPGITEVEGHYQPQTEGSVGRTRSRLHHVDPDPIHTWVERHNRYASWEAHLQANPTLNVRVRQSRSRQGRVFSRAPFKPLTFFLYSYLVRLGFLDGRAGFDYAFALAFYYWLTGAKRRELLRAN